MAEDIDFRLAAVKQAHESLISICDPNLVSDVHPKSAQRDHYRNLLLKVLRDINVLEGQFREDVFDFKNVHRSLPEATLSYYRTHVLPHRRALEVAFDKLDPILGVFFKTIDEVVELEKSRNKVTNTFEVAIDRMQELVDDNPDVAEHFDIDGAYRVIESRLLRFDPSSWLRNSEALRPIRTASHPDVLSMQIRERLIEIYRSYVFGNWLSVLALCRSALEYAIIDNAAKLHISLTYETTMGSTSRTKSLYHLVEDASERLPEIGDAMTEIRDLGNEYIHPKKTKQSKERMLVVAREAARSMKRLRSALEGLYGAAQRDS